MNQSVLVTGAQGFLGSNLIDFFYNNTDYKIYSISRMPLSEKYNTNRVISISQDLLQKLDSQWKQELSAIDYVIHFAGSSDVKKSLKEPLQTFENNVVLTTQLLDFYRQHSTCLKQFLFFSTAEVFGPSFNDKRFTEECRPNPQGPYAFTKASAGQMCKLYSKVYGVPTVITYVMNVYGKNQNSNKFIPKIIRKIANDEVVEIHANCGPDKRNYLHVEDICDAIHFIMKNGSPGQDYNIVNEKYTDNLEIAKLIASILKKQDFKFELKSSDNHHTLSLLDGSKLKNLGWQPKIPLEIGLRKYIYDK